MYEHRRIKGAVSLMLIAVMLLSATGTAAAAESIQPDSRPAVATDEPDMDDPAMPDDPLSEGGPGPSDLSGAEEAGSDPDGFVRLDGTGSEEPSAAVMTAEGSVCPTYQEAYERMIALKTTYPEGLEWTNFKPYGRDGEQSAYRWRGGPVKGAASGVGCAAFAFILSDAAFGDLPARTIDRGSFTFDDVKVGDILRVNDSHFVIVLQKSAGGVTVAEGNYNKSVHWGRAISAAEVEDANFIVTRYPANFDPTGPSDGDEILESGAVGELSWSLSKSGTLTISGAGEIPDRSETEAPPWSAYDERINTIIIESGATRIGNYAFYQSKALAVYIPDGVTSIGQGAFYQSDLLSVTVPGTVKTIGPSAFRECPNLTSATIPEGVVTIGDEAFRGCTALAYIDLPASVTSVGAGAFMSCPKMARVRFMPGRETVTVGDNLFSQCWCLNDVTLPLKVDRISDGMFHSCTMLFQIYVPASVTEIGAQPFAQTGLLRGGTIRFGGSETDWNGIGGRAALVAAQDTKVEYDIPFDDPFAAAPDDPGDLVPDEDPCKDGHVGTADENGNCSVCGKPIMDPPVDPEPSGHEHRWLAAWTCDGTHHWHECGAEDCTVTDKSEKDGYAEHDYGSWTIDLAASATQAGSRHRDCVTCGYRQTASIPATGGSSSGSGDDPGDSGGSDSSVSGPVTTTTIDKDTGAKIQTTKNPDGSSIVITTQKDGTSTAVATDAAGKTEIEVKLSASAIDTAEQDGEPIALPVSEIPVTRDVASAPAISVHTGKDEPVSVSIPVTRPTAGTVAAIVDADGSTEIVKTSALADDHVVLALSDGTAVKIIDNSKSFTDVPDGIWYQDAVAFISARELFSGTTASTFAPDEPMTRAMLMTVLARLDGADTTGGATWYEKGREWAVARGVSDGMAPNSSITREQLVTMVWRYMDPPAAADSLSGYTDAAQISGYARDAMCWAVEDGIISGFGDGRLGPQGQATRAQVAQILKDLIENIALAPARQP